MDDDVGIRASDPNFGRCATRPSLLSPMNQRPRHDSLARIAGMSCPSSATPLIPGGFHDSNSSIDYGSDFSPEEEALLDDLLAKVAPDPHATSTPAVPVPATPAAIAQPPPPSVAAVVQDIEDQYADPSSSRVPRVLGREKPAWQIQSNRPGGGARPAPIPGYIRTASGSSPCLFSSLVCVFPCCAGQA